MSPAQKPDLSPVFAHIDSKQDTFIQRLMDYVRHPSISAQDIGVAEVAQLVERMLTEVGLETRLIPTAGYPMVWAL